MKILIGSHRFCPDVGGIESCTLALALGFTDAGHSVTIHTQSRSEKSEDDHGFAVLRNPSNAELRRAIRAHDVYWQNNVSVKPFLFSLLSGKRPFVTTAVWLTDSKGHTRAVDRLKRFLLRFAHNIYISRSIAEHVGRPGRLIGNPYEDRVFYEENDVEREGELVFLGRLVSDKGCHLLIEALHLIRKASGTSPKLMVIGDGPDRERIQALVSTAGLQDAVSFRGILRREELRTELNRHRILVVPSVWNEPFGVVALEGLACGLVGIVSSGGGLPDAVGPCGLTFTNGDAQDLAEKIQFLLANRATYEDLHRARQEHLAHFSRSAVSAAHLAFFETAH